MIKLHRLNKPTEPLYLNPDLIQTIEAHPDTVVALGNASKFVVRETPEEVCDLIVEWRARIVAEALQQREAPPALAEVVHLAFSHPEKPHV
jgi:flagellar protein FlbD